MALLVDLETISLPAATAVAPSGTDVLHGDVESHQPAGLPTPPTIARFPLSPTISKGGE